MCLQGRRLSAHGVCTPKKCCVGPAKVIQNCLEQYTNELSQQLFKKKNLRGDLSWWLPTFCSLIIQGFVLRTIKASSTTGEELDSKYLQLAVLLFLAVSPKDMNDTDEELLKILLVFGCKTPAECLQDVFGISDKPAKSSRSTNETADSNGNAILRESTEELKTCDQVSNQAAYIQKPTAPTGIDTKKDQLEDILMIDHHDSGEDGDVSRLGQHGKRRLSPVEDNEDEAAHVATAEVLLLVEKSAKIVEIKYALKRFHDH